MTEPIIRVEGLKKYFNENDSWLTRLHPNRQVRNVRAVDGVDLAVESGETLGIVGESGCGKSTLARTILRLLEPTAGRIYFRGDDVTELSQSQLKEFRKNVQIIFQDPFASLNPRYTIERTLTEPMQSHGVGSSKRDRIERAAVLLEEVGLSADHLRRYPHEFSGGQRQRIALARALAVDPSVIVADEPTSALDVSVQAKILNLIQDRKAERDLTIIFISHDLSVMHHISNRVAVMYLGEVIETAETSELFDAPQHPYTKSLISSIPVPDPKNRRRRSTLRGEVPNSIDPPSGCRFHTRCPEVIPPEDWDGGQPAWHEVVGLKTEIDTGTLTAEEVAIEIGRDVEDIEATEAVTDAFIDERFDTTLDGPIRRRVSRAIAHVIEGDHDEAIANFEGFVSPCERHHPDLVTTGSGRSVACHLYHPPEQPLDSSQPSNLPVGD